MECWLTYGSVGWITISICAYPPNPKAADGAPPPFATSCPALAALAIFVFFLSSFTIVSDLATVSARPTDVYRYRCYAS